jgi:hypothetical protein
MKRKANPMAADAGAVEPGRLKRRPGGADPNVLAGTQPDNQVYSVPAILASPDGDAPPLIDNQTKRYPDERTYLQHTGIFGRLVAGEAGEGFVPPGGFREQMDLRPDRPYFVRADQGHGVAIRIWTIADKGHLLADVNTLIRDLAELAVQGIASIAVGAVTHSHYGQAWPVGPQGEDYVLLVNSGGDASHAIFRAAELQARLMERGTEAYQRFLLEAARKLARPQ